MNRRLRTIWTCCVTFVLANASQAAGYDPSFDGDGRLTLGLSPANALTAIQQPDGKLVIAGTSGETLEEIDMVIVRLTRTAVAIRASEAAMEPLRSTTSVMPTAHWHCCCSRTASWWWQGTPGDQETWRTAISHSRD